MMMKKKQRILFLMMFLLLVTLAGCGEEDGPTGEDDKNSFVDTNI